MYKELIRYHKQEGLSFKNVITFNLDEYYPLEKVKHLGELKNRNHFVCVVSPEFIVDRFFILLF